MDGAGNGTLNPLVGDERSGDGGESRTPFILIEELLPVLRRLMLVLHLGRHGPNLRSAHGDQLRRPWPGLDAASTAVVGDVPVVVVIYDDGAVVHICNPGDVDPIDRAVVIEVIAAPVATVITVAGIAAAIGHTAVEADVKAPVAAIETITVAEKSPVAGSPERPGKGSGDPGAWYPVVSDGRIAPISGSPDVIGRGSFGLLIGGQGRRRLVGFFDGLLAGIDLVVVVLVVVIVLSVLIVHIGGILSLRGRLRSVLLVLLGLLLTFVLLTLPESAGWRLDWSGHGGLGLARLVYGLRRIDWGHVRVRRVRAGVIHRLACGGLPMTTGE